jgi:hypothetical protein
MLKTKANAESPKVAKPLAIVTKDESVPRESGPKSAMKQTKLNPYFAEIKKKLCDPAVPVKKVTVKEKEENVKKSVKGLLSDKLPPPRPATAHRRYSPVYACANTLLAKKWDDATWKRHREKIKTMKACIDNANSVQASAVRGMKKNIAKQGTLN